MSTCLFLMEHANMPPCPSGMAPYLKCYGADGATRIHRRRLFTLVLTNCARQCARRLHLSILVHCKVKWEPKLATPLFLHKHFAWRAPTKTLQNCGLPASRPISLCHSASHSSVSAPTTCPLLNLGLPANRNCKRHRLRRSIRVLVF